MQPHRRARLLTFAPIRLAIALLVVPALATSPALSAADAPPPGPARPANGPPVANNDSMAAFTNQRFQTLYVLDNDTDPDNDTLTITDVGFAQHGQAAPDFLDVDYQPNPNFSGTDTFTYTVSDGHSHSATAMVTVHVANTGTATTRFAVYATSQSGYDSSRWTISPLGGATSATASGQCNGAAGLAVEDVLLQNPLAHYNAFDNGLTLWVDSQQVTPVLPMAVTHRSLTSGPVLLGGVNVTVVYDGLTGGDTLRTRVQFANTSGSTKAITATVATNVGSDSNTVIVGTSSGDTSFTTADRWLVTSDSPTSPGEIVDTHVLYGPGSPAATPSAVFNTTFVCNEQSVGDTHGVRARFNLSIPNNSTQELLFFNQVHSANTTALADAAAFNSNPLTMLAGLTNGDLARIVNWKIGPITWLYLPQVIR